MGVNKGGYNGHIEKDYWFVGQAANWGWKNKNVLDVVFPRVSEALGIVLKKTAFKKAHKITIFSDS